MSVDETRAMIVDVLAAIGLVDEHQAKSDDIEFAGLGIDSMKVVDLCMELEERIGREISVEELIENPTVNRLAEHFAKSGGGPASAHGPD